MAEFLSFIASKWTILVALLFFGVIVMVHELGHFTFAKLFKVKVNEFSMGMGPKLFGKKKGDTQYSVRLFPIGGFVSMEGEDEDSEDERAFNKKPCWQRIVIVVSGALVNIFLGLILVAVTLTISDGYAGTNYIHSFNVDSKQVAEYNGLKSQDKVIKIDGRNILPYPDQRYQILITDRFRYILPNRIFIRIQGFPGIVLMKLHPVDLIVVSDGVAKVQCSPHLLFVPIYECFLIKRF
jgi:RIP metalloprotease RseP